MPKTNPAVERRLEGCFTVRELIEQLENCDPDLPVFFAYPAGDYWKNTLAGSVENLEEKQITWSEYHRTFKVPSEDRDMDDEEKEDAVDAVVLG